MISVTLRMPEDVVEDLKRIAPLKGYSGYQALMRSYVGAGLRDDMDRFEKTDVAKLLDRLRASGVPYDIRKIDHYSIYDRFKFRVPLGEVGDVYDRYYVRILEMRESVKILEQAIQEIPEGEYITKIGATGAKSPRNFKPPKADAYGRIESPKGELGFYLVSDGTAKPYRYHVRAPSFINLTVLEDMCLGHKVADAIIILGSVDIVLGEVDR